MPESHALPDGFRAAGIHCGLKKSPEQPDLGLLLADEARPASALFTKNRLLGAHVTLCRQHLDHSGGRVRAVLVNAKNANCATGRQGVEDARSLCEDLAGRLGCPAEQVLVISTGVIGARLPVDKIRAGLDRVLEAARPDGGDDFARAIMTTDTVPKGLSVSVEHEGRRCTVTGIVKGSGMIRPDMATMLCYVVTDARAARATLQRLLDGVVARTFNRVTVDGDTSTNDACVLVATGQSEFDGDSGSGAADVLAGAVEEVCGWLARSLVRDGEGATKRNACRSVSPWPTRRWSRRPSSPAIPTGAGSSPRSGVPGSTGCWWRMYGSGSVTSASSSRAGEAPATPRRPASGSWTRRRSTCASNWDEARRRPPSGPATSRTTTSRSTPSTAPEPAVDEEPRDCKS